MKKNSSFLQKARLCLCLVFGMLWCSCAAIKPQESAGGRKTYSLVIAVPMDDLPGLLSSVDGNVVSVVMMFDQLPYSLNGKARLLLSVNNDIQLKNMERQLAACGIRVIATSCISDH